MLHPVDPEDFNLGIRFIMTVSVQTVVEIVVSRPESTDRGIYLACLLYHLTRLKVESVPCNDTQEDLSGVMECFEASTCTDLLTKRITSLSCLTMSEMTFACFWQCFLVVSCFSYHSPPTPGRFLFEATSSSVSTYVVGEQVSHSTQADS